MVRRRRRRSARRIATHLEAAKVTTDPDGGRRGFGATKPGTMTSWAQSQGATAIQIEISRSYRAAQSADKLKERLITGLVAALRDEQHRLYSHDRRPSHSPGAPDVTRRLSPWRRGNRLRGRR